MLPQKFFYVAVEYYDKDGNRTRRMFVKDRAFGSMYSFTLDVNEARLFTSNSAAVAYMRNYILPTRAMMFFEDCYI